MTSEKFLNEMETLDKFFTIYCSNKHSHQNHYSQKIVYNKEEYRFDFTLCEECKKLLQYSIDKLENCEHDPKPRCRKCSKPCYDKDEWKKLAKLMRYSGIQLGIIKIKKMLNLYKD